MAGAEGDSAGDDRERAAKGAAKAEGFAENRHAEMVVRAGAGREGGVGRGESCVR